MSKKRTTKAPNAKEVLKNSVREIILTALIENGITVSEDYEAYGFTKGTLLVKGENADVQVKFMSPKAGIDHYEEIEEIEE
jgi:hypothetical protein